MAEQSRPNQITSGGIKMTAETSDDMLLVEGYGNGGFRLMGRRFEGGLLVLPDGVHPISAVDVESLSVDDLQKVFDATDKPDLVLFGMGERLTLIPKHMKAALDTASIGYDPMDTGAAARTYNVLVIEGRRVAALLLPVGSPQSD